MASAAINTWGGVVLHPVEILGSTPARVRVRAVEDMWLPGNRRVAAGETVLVPTYSVRQLTAPGTLPRTAYSYAR